MTTKPPDAQTTTPSRRITESTSYGSYALLLGVLVVSLPFLMMLIMMLVMGWMRPMMPGGIAMPVGFFAIVGFVGFIVLGGVWYGAYRLVSTDEVRA